MITTVEAWTAWRDAIAAALRAQPNLDVLVDGIDINGEPTYRLDPDKRVHMTAVLWMGVGVPTEGDDALCGGRELGSLSWQVTCVGGDTNRAARAALKTRAALTGEYLTGVDGRALEQFDQLTISEDKSASPSRFYVPIAYTAQLA